MELSVDDLVDWPPFYTYPLSRLQPNADTREQQLGMWAQRIVNHCRTARLFSITPEDISALTQNPRIRRRLKDDALQAVFAYMRKSGLGEMDGPKLMVFWKKLDAWGALVLRWAEGHGKIGGIETVVGLCSGDDTRREEFFGMPPTYMQAVLAQLESVGKVSLFDISGSTAVKFLR